MIRQGGGRVRDEGYGGGCKVKYDVMLLYSLNI